MSEPVSPATIAASLPIGAGGVVVAGFYTGLDYDVLVSGLAGALFAMKYLEASSTLSRSIQAIGYTILAAWCAPPIADYIARHAEIANVASVRLPASALLAYLLPVAMPRARALVSKWSPPSSK